MKRTLLYVVACAILLALPLTMRADGTAQTLPLSQDWSNTGLITTSNVWDGVPGIVGYRGDALVGGTGVDPRTIVADGTGTPVNVIANQTNPNTLTTGGVAEFEIANAAIALQGSGTARAPFVLINLDATAWPTIHVAYNLRDIDGSADNAVQPVALQYRVGSSGNFTNVPGGFVADATTGPTLATLVTPISVNLPPDAGGQPVVQLRIITSDAAGSDEWVGIDDIAITGSTSTPPSGTGAASPSTVAIGNQTQLTVTVTPGANPMSTGLQVAADLTSIGGSAAQLFTGDGSNVFSFDATVSPGTPPGTKSLPFSILDAEGRTGSGSISLSVVNAPTPPTGIGAADPSTVATGGATMLSVTVTPGMNPASTGLQVTADLTSIGGSAAQAFTDSGNNIFSFQATVSPGTLAGGKSLPFTILDAEGRVGTGSVSLQVVDAPTNPTGTGTASPSTVESGSNAVLNVSVVPGMNPTSTGLTVTADLTSIGGSAAQPFTDGGSNNFSYTAPVSPGTTAGGKSLPFTILDAEGRVGSGSISLTVVDPPPPVLIPPIPFFENWSNIARITTDDNWSAVQGIVGYRGDGLVSSSAVNPQTIVADGSNTPVDVNANRPDPNTFTTGGVTEFHITNPTIALQGSGTADAPHIVVSVDTTGHFGIRVSYNVRDIDGSADNATQPVALQYRVGATGSFTNVPAGFVPDATSGPSLATLVTPVIAVLPADASNQPLVQIRIITSDAVGSDEWVGIDDISVTDAITDPTGVGLATPSAVEAGDTSLLTVAVTPGQNPDSTGLSVTMDLTPIGGLTIQPFFDNGTSGDVIAGDNVFSFHATVANGTSTGLKTLPGFITDFQGRSTATSIALDVITPPQITAIHDIQGAGQLSPFNGHTVTTTGIVTARKFNGFFIQTPDGLVDNNSNSSEGVFVFTSSTPPSAAAVGNFVRVTGAVQEFIPAADPFQLPLTELTFPTVVVLSSGNIVPAPTVLSASDTSPAGTLDQLERFEGMRVQVHSLLITAGTGGNVSEPNATATSDGVFYGVVPPNVRPFREPGIHAFDPLPPGSPSTVMRFDGNPELIRVDSDALIGAPRVNVTAGEVVGTIIGALDYGFRTYTILPEPELPIVVDETVEPTPVSVPTANQFTVAAYNLERFFDTVDAPGIGEPVLTSTAFNNRLNKISLVVRNILRTPDILAVEEVENLATLQAVASKINADVTAGGEPNPNYVAYLEEGNDVGGIDVGFLVKSARVTVLDVEQVGKDATYINPVNNQPELLNDRPSLVLRAIVASANGATSPITVIANHLRSLLGLEDADGRVRAKRHAQAVFLADWIQDRQEADPDEHIISVGDYNAFQFSDGYVDTIGTIQGTPTPASEVVLAGGDLVNPDLVNLIETVPAVQRYSYVFDGNAQAIDHALVTQNLLPRVDRLQFGRAGADFPETARTNPNTPARLSDHDPLVVFFNFPPPPQLSINDVTVTEGNAGMRSMVFTVSLTPASTLPVSVDFLTTNGTARAGEDYVVASDKLSFAPGTTTQPIAVLVSGDNILEPDEVFFVKLLNAANAVIADDQGIGIIVDDDDDDGDGVADIDDACPATPPGAIVNGAGCSIAQICSPTASWKNHGQYVSCVSNTADAFFNAALITAEQAEAITAAAAKSTVGKQ